MSELNELTWLGAVAFSALCISMAIGFGVWMWAMLHGFFSWFYVIYFAMGYVHE